MKFPIVAELAEKLKADVYDLCLPEGRVVGSAGHQVAEEFLARRLRETGCQPYSGDRFELRYSAQLMSSTATTEHEFTNLIGVIPGADRDLPPVLVGAHYDSVIDAPCADDNGAAVAICLAIAEAVHAAGGLDRDLIVAIFDAEEPPHFVTPSMGSVRFHADQLDSRGVHFALIFDLVGHDITVPDEMLATLGESLGIDISSLPLEPIKEFLFMTGAESHSELARVVNESGVPDGLKLLATLNEYIGDMSDHGVFRRNGVPYLFFSCGRWEHYHRVTDTPDRLSYPKMARIAQLSGDILERVAREPLSQSSSGDHSLKFEIQKMGESLGLALPLVMGYLGLSKLETREDVKKIVDAFSSLGL